MQYNVTLFCDFVCDQELTYLQLGQAHNCLVTPSRSQRMLMLIVPLLHWFSTRRVHPAWVLCSSFHTQFPHFLTKPGIALYFTITHCFRLLICKVLMHLTWSLSWKWLTVGRRIVVNLSRCNWLRTWVSKAGRMREICYGINILRVKHFSRLYDTMC